MEIDYLNLLGLTLIAVGAPLLMDLLRLPIPDAVAMILLGIGFGGSGLGWIDLDGAVELLSAAAAWALRPRPSESAGPFPQVPDTPVDAPPDRPETT